jgi:hypothetical protein
MADIGLSRDPFLTFVKVVGKLKGPADQIVTGGVNLPAQALCIRVLMVTQDTAN